MYILVSNRQQVVAACYGYKEVNWMLFFPYLKQIESTSALAVKNYNACDLKWEWRTSSATVVGIVVTRALAAWPLLAAQLISKANTSLRIGHRNSGDSMMIRQ